MLGTTPTSPCPAPESNNKYHLTTNPYAPLILRVLRVVGYILLHILTLGILLLIHYCKYHCFQERGLPRPPSPSYAPSEKTLSQVKKKPGGRETPPTPPPPLDPQELRIPTMALPKLSKIPKILSRPRHIIPGSLQDMVWQQTQGKVPIAAQMLLPTHLDINPDFLASYPTPIVNDPLIPFRHYISDPQDPSIPRHQSLYAQQMHYLNQHYYIVNVPGDGHCFYRAYTIGWLCSIFERSRHNPQAFANEANMISRHPFAQSSARANQLSTELANLLYFCSHLTSLQQLFDSILHSEKHVGLCIVYLRHLASYAVHQQIQVLGEENARVAYILDLEELLPETLGYFREKAKKSLWSNMISSRPLPPTSAKEHACLLIEFLPWILSTEEEKRNLTPQEREAQELLEKRFQRLFTSIDSHLKLKEPKLARDLNQILAKLSIQETINFQYYLNTLERRHPHVKKQYSPLFLWVAFLHTCPHLQSSPLAKKAMSAFQQALKACVGNQNSLTQALSFDSNSPQEASLNSTLDHCWQQQITEEVILHLFTTINSLKDAHRIPQLERLYRRLAILMHKRLVSLLQKDPTIIDGLLKNVNSIENNLPKELLSEYKNLCSSPCLHMRKQQHLNDEQQKNCNKGVYMLFFILQNPSLLSHPQCQNFAKNVLNLLFPYLQCVLKKPENLEILQGLTSSILGSITLPPLPLPEDTFSHDIARYAGQFAQYFASHPEVLPLNAPLAAQLRELAQTAFADLEETAQNLYQEISQHHPQEWEKFVDRLNILGYQGSRYPQARPPLKDSFANSLPIGFLLFSFLKNYPGLLQRGSPLEQQLKTFFTTASQKFRDTLHCMPKFQETFARELPKLKDFVNTQETIIRALFRKADATPFPLVAFRKSFLDYLCCVSAEELHRILSEVNTQAEGSHVAALATTLNRTPALCQVLNDPEVNLAVSAQTVENHGFLSAGFANENEAEIFLIRFPNHYGCLLPKTPKPPQ
ncbi:hypothetical protein [Chlamydia pecorum]|uniref:OTU domain-containing protein n=1 Tax=Chlamydia pecorum (strain ATCC VR-628 / DSM 29919 / E58) TaxID=331635 RepID=A0AA34RD63_CHLPE|nr:hypothetical protein [Chlamydia pecorum]AEB41561.1 conserved hypothetical protein [Chlamydia pecorum E58]UFP07107.1 hypothetical protein KY091_01985 [Chlamydia pecorum]UJT76934.1 hypothetical protein NSWBovSBE_0536 [Chlamydia pecorum]